MATFHRKPIVKFNNLTDTGVNKLSVGSIVTYTDSNDNNSLIEILNTTGMTDTSTLTDFLGTPANYKHIAKEVVGAPNFSTLSDTPATYTGSESKIVAVNAAGNALEFIDAPTNGSTSTGLETISVSGFNGYRFIGADDSYGSLGLLATDLSISLNTLKDSNNVLYPMGTLGATGAMSIAMGLRATSSGDVSIAIGAGSTASGSESLAIGQSTLASTEYMTVIGRANVGTNALNSFEVGIGTDIDDIRTPKNGLEITKTGGITAPEFLVSEITTPKHLITKEFLDAKTTSFASLTDTPVDFTGATGKTLVVNAAEDGIEFTSAAGGGASTGLEKITENLKSGWRLVDSNATKYKDIGIDSIDLNVHNTEILDIDGNPYAEIGTTGDNSASFGTNNTVSEELSITNGIANTVSGKISTAFGTDNRVTSNVGNAFGARLSVNNDYMTAVGTYNVGTDTNNLFEIGIGDVAGRKNALEIDKNGTVSASSMVVDNITLPKHIVTKEYLDKITGADGDDDGGATLLGGLLKEVTENGNTGIKFSHVSPEFYGPVGKYSIDFGLYKIKSNWKGTIGINAISVGHNSSVLGDSLSFGHKNIVGEDSISLGSGNFLGELTTTLGFYNYSMNPLGNYILGHKNDLGYVAYATTVLGNRNEIASPYSTVIGDGNNILPGSNMYIGGNRNKASGLYNTIVGSYSSAHGLVNTLIGFVNKANNSYSTAIGFYCTANGKNSVAIGTFATANNDEMVALGRMNKATNKDNIFELGAGSQETGPRNVMEISRSGLVTIDTSMEEIVSNSGKIVPTKEWIEYKDLGLKNTPSEKLHVDIITEKTFYVCTNFPLNNNPIVMIGGIIQDSDSYTIVGSKLTFTFELEINQIVIIIDSTNYDVHSEYATQATGYVITPSFTMKEAVLVFLDGVLQSQDTYSITGNDLTLNLATTNTEITILSSTFSYVFRENGANLTPDGNGILVIDSNFLITQESILLLDGLYESVDLTLINKNKIRDYRVTNKTDILVLKA